jgi:hypothetical protein
MQFFASRSSGFVMKPLAALAFVALCALSLPVDAAELPALKASERNRVPDCVTPGRLMAFVKARAPGMDARFDGVATEYMRHGEELQIRWDIAFFQMLVETGNLTFKGDVKPKQNNFAGLGATGGGEPGESFKDVSSGVRAHLQHILMYAGERIENPIAERTRKVQEWGVLTSWQKSLKGPMTFSQLTRKWSPRDRGYANDIDSVAQAFMSGACKGPDPRPELVAEARKDLLKLADAESKGARAAKRQIEAERAEGAPRSGLGGPPPTAVAAIASPPPSASAQKPPVALTVLNAAATEPPPAAAESLRTTSSKPDQPAPIETAALGPTLPKPGSKAPPCRVWTASYGGNKAMIIKVVQDQTTNYTVLDVNDGREKREAEAYIAAYAKGGQTVGEFSSQDQALDKAFELCPEG